MLSRFARHLSFFGTWKILSHQSLPDDRCLPGATALALRRSTMPGAGTVAREIRSDEVCCFIFLVTQTALIACTCCASYVTGWMTECN